VTCACVPHPAGGSGSEQALVCITRERFVDKKRTVSSSERLIFENLLGEIWILTANLRSDEKEGSLQPRAGGSDRSHPRELNLQQAELLPWYLPAEEAQVPCGSRGPGGSSRLRSGFCSRFWASWLETHRPEAEELPC